MEELINGAQAFPLHIAFTCVTETKLSLPCRRIDIGAEGQAEAYHSYHFDYVDTVSQPF